jgi:hypothetical protein
MSKGQARNDHGIDLRGQCRSDAGGQALRARTGIPFRDLRHVVNQGCDPRIYPTLVVVGEDGHHRQPQETFFNLRKTKSKISALEEGDLRPDQVKLIARRLGVTEQDVVDMDRLLGGDVSLNACVCRKLDSAILVMKAAEDRL